MKNPLSLNWAWLPIFRAKVKASLVPHSGVGWNEFALSSDGSYLLFTQSSFSELSVVSYVGALKGRGKVLPFAPSRDKGPVSSLWLIWLSHPEADWIQAYLPFMQPLRQGCCSDWDHAQNYLLISWLYSKWMANSLVS